MTQDEKKGIDYSLLMTEVFDNIPYYVFWKDKNLVFQGCNKQFAHQFGYDNSKDIIGKADKDFPWSDELREKYNNDDLYVINTGESLLDIEESQAQGDGSIKIVLVSKIPLYNADKTIVGVVGFYTDVSKIKQTEKELHDTKHKLDGMTLVSASLAHELRTPFATLSLGLKNINKTLPALFEATEEAIKAGLNVPKINTRSLNSLKKQFNNMQRITRSAFKVIDILLMNVRPLETGQIGIGSFMINACIKQALEQYPFASNERELVSYQEGIDFQVKGKIEYLTHVIFNLLKNAIYYVKEARKGGISIWTDSTEDANYLYFKDTGAGIRSEVLKHIFERFFTETYHGAGVGLAFCRMVMHSLSGDISCESKKGAFTTFKMSFPKIVKQ